MTGLDGKAKAALGGFAMLALVLAVISPGESAPGDAPAATAEDARKAAAQAAENAGLCRKLAALVKDAPVIKARKGDNRIDVEDRLWAMAPADVKEMLARSVACSKWGMPVPPEEGTDGYVVVYGYRSGKRLMMLTAYGPQFE